MGRHRNGRLRQSRVGILWGMFHGKNVDFAGLIWEDFQYQIDYRHSGLNTNKDDGAIQRLKFVNKGEDFQEYGRAISDTMLTDEIKQSKAYKAFIAYSTGLMPPKKIKDVFIFADDDIIPEPDVALELGKSISKTEAEIAEEERRFHETHERC
ncbi:hypothetical protein Tco_0719439 [Tanacetum coccineum]